MPTAGITSLGCPRNLLDSEIIIGSLKSAGFKVVDIEENPDICLINTCAFIQSARQEAVDAILEAAQLKKEGKVKYLVVCGCLPQMYKEKLTKELPEADLFIGTSDFPNAARLIHELIDHPQKKSGSRLAVSSHLDYLYDDKSPRVILTSRHYAYVKISEGCSNFCSYCIISRLRGSFRSRTIGSILKEVRDLTKGGRLKEINLIGQDTTLFGIDRYGKAALPVLLRRLCESKNSVKWVRILYTHPAHYTNDLISVIRDEKKICKYLDLPIQHISDSVLKRMNRKIQKNEIIELIENLRDNIPDLILRTSVIVGFPGETDKDFQELMAFLHKTKFERLGAFMYSQEEGTRAASFESQVPEKVKSQRFDAVMAQQQEISSQFLKSFLNKTIDVLIDEKDPDEKDKFIGRTQGDAPEIDGSVYVSGKNIKVGEFYKVKITDTLEYDLVGKVRA